jgi:FkbM family methyltransferase
VELNRYRNVTFVEVAIGAPLGRAEFVLSGETAYVGSNATAAVNDGRRVAVRCVSPDEAFDRFSLPAPDLVKMDIEGAEADALRHCECLAERARPVLLLELHNPECDAEAWRFARRFGYTITTAASGRMIERSGGVSGTVLLLPSAPAK